MIHWVSMSTLNRKEGYQLEFHRCAGFGIGTLRGCQCDYHRGEYLLISDQSWSWGSQIPD